jgi:hypothetical protein
LSAVATVQREERGVTGHGLPPWSVCERERERERERESKREGKKKIKVWPKFNLKFEKFKV